MQLRDYLHAERLTCTELAKAVGVHRVYMTGIKNGKIKPGLRLARDIVDRTGGKVTLDDLLRH